MGPAPATGTFGGRFQADRWQRWIVTHDPTRKRVEFYCDGINVASHTEDRAKRMAVGEGPPYALAEKDGDLSIGPSFHLFRSNDEKHMPGLLIRVR
jgi:hypothetical protein